VTAIASRSLAQARSVAPASGFPRLWLVRRLLADPDIDVVYNPLPNDLHVSYTLAAAAPASTCSAKKPIGLNAADAAGCGGAPRSHHRRSLHDAISSAVAAGAGTRAQRRPGEVRTITCFFGYHNIDPQNIRNDPPRAAAWRGTSGATRSSARAFTSKRSRSGSSRWWTAIRTSRRRLTSALVDFGGGRRLDFTVSGQAVAHQSVQGFREPEAAGDSHSVQRAARR
jgi:hypothetical protein